MTSKALHSSQRLVAIWLLALVVVGCSDRERLPNVESGQAPTGTSSTNGNACSTPKEGCACTEPGSVIDCGEVASQSDDYVTCTQGVRVCSSEGKWGECSGTQTIQKSPASSTIRTQALGTSSDCTAVNPCDPLCREVVDTGTGLTNLPEYLCSTSLGLEVCRACGYARGTSNLAYKTIPTPWQAIPASCTTTADNCVMDTHCVDGRCVNWTEPCQSANTVCSFDLTLGRPCVGLLDPKASFHIPVCNRGANRLDSGTIRIGVDSRISSMGKCVPLTTTDLPDKGSIDFKLSTTQGSYLEPGQCIDVNAGNAVVSNLDLTSDRALVVNVLGAVAECNKCNNSNVFIKPTSESTGSICADCTGLSCTQTNVATTLRGVIYDPAGRRPIPNVTVYVPSTEVAQLSNASQATCDTCSSLISGSPIAIVRSDATGQFTLPNVPAGVGFPLVVQTGRWRRQFTIGAILPGNTRWVGNCTPGSNTTGNSSGDCTVVEVEPTSVPEADRLRLARTQRRCIGGVCGGEGDIPKMALIMGDADPMQCLLRRIGVAESEMTGSSGAGRVHLFNHNGMQFTGAQKGFGAGGLLEDVEQLKEYAALLAPCDYKHSTAFGSDTEGSYTGSVYRSGPSYNSPPKPTASDVERANVKAYVDGGGRLFTSHWLSMDFIHLNYSPPARPVVKSGSTLPFLSPYDPNGDLSFVDQLSSLASSGLTWKYQSVDDYNPTAPVVHLFGRVIEAVSRVSDPTVYPYFDYTIDQDDEVGADLAVWAAKVGATPAAKPGTLRFQSWSPMVRAVRADLGVSRLAYGDARNADAFYYEGTKPAYVPELQQPCIMTPVVADAGAFYCTKSKHWGDEQIPLYQFDTPLDSANKCGRVVAAQSHVTKHACNMPSGARSACAADGSGTDCSCVTLPAAAEWTRGCGDSTTALNALTPEELAFEFMLFSTTQCLGEVIPPSQGAPLPTVSFTRAFEADCARGEQPVWQLFSVQATIPEGTSVGIRATTGDSQQSIVDGETKWVNVATWTSSTSTWTSSEHTLDYYFRHQLSPAEVSRRWLEVSITLSPNLSVSPTVSQWRAVYNCVPAE